MSRTSSSPPPGALPPAYRPDQLLTEAAYRRHLANQKTVRQLVGLIVFAAMIGLFLLFGTSVAEFVGGLLSDAVSDATQTSGS